MLTHIDGRKNVRAISQATNIDVEICKMAVQHLVFFKLVTLHDLFQFTNKYVAGPNLINNQSYEVGFW